MKRKVVRLLVSVALSVAVGFGVWSIFNGPAVSEEFAQNADVVSAIASLIAVSATLAAFLRALARESGPLPVALSAEQEREAVEHLAREMTWVWRDQARLQGVHRVLAPVAVRWRWAGDDIAAPPEDFRRFAPDLRTEGTIAELSSGLYRALPPDTRIVLLGDAGAGKTGAVLTLLLDALAARRTQPDQPVPVLLSLGGWHPDRPLRDWAAKTIARDYRTAAPGVAPERVAAELLRRDRIALFLDGLDEMDKELRGRALKEIDDQALGLRVVLTSRCEEYQTALATGQLGAAAVVKLQPPDAESVEAFFITGLVGARRAPWCEVSAYLRDHPRSVAAKALETPLALTLARQTYLTEGDPTELIAEGAFDKPDDVLRHLIGRFLRQAYPDERSREDALHWLGWIAHEMDGPDFGWWHIPRWLPSWGFAAFCGLVAGIGAGAVTAVATALAVGPGRAIDTAAAVNDGWVAGLVVGPVVAFLVAFPTKLWPGHTGFHHQALSDVLDQRMVVRDPRSLSVPGRGLRAVGALFRALDDAINGASLAAAGLGVTSVAVFLVVGFGQTLSARIGYGVLAGVLVFLAAFVGGVFALGFLNVFTRPLTDSAATTPSRSYAADRAVTGVYAAVVLLFAGVAVAVLFGLRAFDRPPLEWLVFVEPSQRFVTWLALAVGLGGGVAVILAVGLATHAVPAVKIAELVLRLRHGRRVRLPALLDTALRRQVLRQAGAVYQFRHAAIQEHLAALHTRTARTAERTWVRPVLLSVGGAAAVAVVVATTVAVQGKPFLAVPGYRDQVTAFALAPDGATVAAAGGDNTIRIADIATGRVLHELTGHTHKVYGMAFAPGGGVLASRAADGTVRVWDARAGRLTRTIAVLPTTEQVVFSPDGATVAAADGSSVRLWDAATGASVREIRVGSSPVHGIGFTARGRWLVTTDEDENVTLWDPATGARGKNLPDGDKLAVSDDGSTVAVYGATTRVADGATGDQRREIGSLLMWPAALSPDGTALVGQKWGNLWLVDTSTGRDVRRLTFPDRWSVGEVAFGADGDVVAASVDQRVVLWDPGTGRIVRTVCFATTYRTDSRYTDCG